MGGGDAAASVSFPLWAWSVFVGLVVELLFLDLFVLHRSAKKIPFRESLRFTGFWVAIALAFGGFVWYLAGPEVAGEYLASYLVEWSLSLDNVFVWAVIFSSFAVPEEYRYHVLLWGVMGALLAAEIYARLAGVGRAADVVVVTPEDIERFGDSPALIIIEPAPREGKVVYAASPNRYPPDDPREWLNRARLSTRRHRRSLPLPLL